MRSQQEDDDETWSEHPAPQYDRTEIKASSNDTALIVIDMQESFREYCPQILPRIIESINTCKRMNVPIFFTQHSHKDLSTTLAKWWRHPIKYGSDRWKILKELRELTTDEVVIDSKQWYDAFQDTNLHQELEQRNIKSKCLIVNDII
jgi:nicotinamidase-related amidase